MSIFKRGHVKSKWRKHVNPDGSKGGTIHQAVTVEGDVFIPVHAIVIGAVNVTKDTDFSGGNIVTKAGAFSFSPT